MQKSFDASAPSYFVGIAGGSAGGKTSLAKALVAEGGNRVAILELDRFYHSVSMRKDSHKANFDEPAALDFKLLHTVLGQLRTHGVASVPKYDFATHKRVGYENLVAAPLIIVEGILALWNGKVRDLLDFKIYVDAPPEVRFQRRLQRDMSERGRDAASIEQQWHETVQPMHHKYVEPSRQHAYQVIDGTTNLQDKAGELLAAWLNTSDNNSRDTSSKDD